MGHINGMIVQSEGSRPHVIFIMKALANTFPNIIWKIGGKVARTTWGGGFSAHSVGRACDIYLDANDPLDRRLGDLLFETFITHGYNFKVDHTIWNGRTWSQSEGGPSGYTGSGGAHRDPAEAVKRLALALKNELDGLAVMTPAELRREREEFFLRLG